MWEPTWNPCHWGYGNNKLQIEGIINFDKSTLWCKSKYSSHEHIISQKITNDQNQLSNINFEAFDN